MGWYPLEFVTAGLIVTLDLSFVSCFWWKETNTSALRLNINTILELELFASYEVDSWVFPFWSQHGFAKLVKGKSDHQYDITILTSGIRTQVVMQETTTGFFCHE